MQSVCKLKQQRHYSNNVENDTLISIYNSNDNINMILTMKL